MAAAAPHDEQTLYGAQMYDCVVTIALAAEAAGSAEATAIGAQIESVTSGGRSCSTFVHCKALLAAGEGIAYSGASGGLEIDAEGDISTTRLTTSAFLDGSLVEVSSREIDLITERRLQVLSSAVLMTQVQQALRALGYYDGDITGFYNAETGEALRALQRDLGLPETGEYDAATDEALRARLGAGASTLSLATSQLQLELQALGYYDGPIDGRWSTATADAVRAFQIRIGVPPTGLLDSTTLRQVYVLGQQNPLQPPPPPVTDPTTPRRRSPTRPRRPSPSRPRRPSPTRPRRRSPRRRTPPTTVAPTPPDEDPDDDDSRGGDPDRNRRCTPHWRPTHGSRRSSGSCARPGSPATSTNRRRHSRCWRRRTRRSTRWTARRETSGRRGPTCAPCWRTTASSRRPA